MRTWLLGLMLIGCDGSAQEADNTPPAPSAPAPAAEEAPRPDPSVLPNRSVATKPGEYNFSKDLFSDRIETWSKVLEPFKGRPDLKYLEVGVFEGRAVVWMLENVLTDPSSKVTAVDIFPEDLEQRFLDNVALTGRADDVTTLVGPSERMLRDLPPESFQIAYIDGSHTADDVLADAVLTWTLLEPGGVLIFDDFLWSGRGEGGMLPVELRPSLGVSAFITAYRNTVEVLVNDYQVILRKTVNPCPSKHYCSPLGTKHAYLWRQRQLIEAATRKILPTTGGQRQAIEALLRSRTFGDAGFERPADDSVLAALVEEHDLQLPPRVAPLAEVDRHNLLGVATPPAGSEDDSSAPK